MKYIRTKDGEIFDYEPTHDIDVDGFIVQHINGWNEPLMKEDIIKTADTIEELCDVIIYTDKYGNHEIIYGSLEQKKTRIEEIKKMGLRQSDAFYGAIWVFDSNGAPALKPVAKMNEKGNWNCYETN